MTMGWFWFWAIIIAWIFFMFGVLIANLLSVSVLREDPDERFRGLAEPEPEDEDDPLASISSSVRSTSAMMEAAEVDDERAMK